MCAVSEIWWYHNKGEIFKGRDEPVPVPTLNVEIPATTLSIEYDKKVSLITPVLIVPGIAKNPAEAYSGADKGDVR